MDVVRDIQMVLVVFEGVHRLLTERIDAHSLKAASNLQVRQRIISKILLKTFFKMARCMKRYLPLKTSHTFKSFFQTSVTWLCGGQNDIRATSHESFVICFTLVRYYKFAIILGKHFHSVNIFSFVRFHNLWFHLRNVILSVKAYSFQYLTLQMKLTFITCY